MLADDSAAVQAVGQVQHVGEGAPVTSCDVVDAAVVAIGPMWNGDAKAEFAFLMNLLV